MGTINSIPALLHPVHRPVRFGIRPVCGKVGRNGIDLILDSIQPGFNTVQPFPQIGFNPVDLVAQHLVPFYDDIQLVLKIFGYYTRLVLNLSLEVVGHYADMMLENLLDLFYFISVHNISR
jgi:hypothetical protein